MKKLTKGQIVSVYQDPVTCTKLEGPAKLKKRLDTYADPGYEWWMVEFDGEGTTYQRKINLNKC